MLVIEFPLGVAGFSDLVHKMLKAQRREPAIRGCGRIQVHVAEGPVASLAGG